MRPKLIHSTVKGSKTRPHGERRRPFGHHLVSDADLLKRINQALAWKGLRLQPTRPESITDDGRTGYEVVYRERVFNLRIGIEDFARALGILRAPAHVHRHARTQPCVCELR